MATSSRRLSFSERERKILNAAVWLFSRRGFKGTTTKAIADEAGINEALLYRHFKTKDDLYKALLKNKLKEWTTAVVPPLEKTYSLPVFKALVRIFLVIVRKIRKDPSLLRMMFFSALENHEISCLFFKERLPLIEFLEKFFRRKKAEGKIADFDAPILARSFLGLIHHYVLVRDIFQAPRFFPKSETKMIEEYVNIFTRGVLP